MNTTKMIAKLDEIAADTSKLKWEQTICERQIRTCIENYFRLILSADDSQQRIEALERRVGIIEAIQTIEGQKKDAPLNLDKINAKAQTTSDVCDVVFGVKKDAPVVEKVSPCKHCEWSRERGYSECSCGREITPEPKAVECSCHINGSDNCNACKPEPKAVECEHDFGCNCKEKQNQITHTEKCENKMYDGAFCSCKPVTPKECDHEWDNTNKTYEWCKKCGINRIKCEHDWRYNWKGDRVCRDCGEIDANTNPVDPVTLKEQTLEQKMRDIICKGHHPWTNTVEKLLALVRSHDSKDTITISRKVAKVWVRNAEMCDLGEDRPMVDELRKALKEQR